MSTTIYLHHHGDFTPPPTVTYVGGRTEVIKDFDSDLLSFRDLEDFAIKYEYDVNALVYFKCDGHNFKDGTRLIYDDVSVRDLVALSKPYGRIDLYVDHFDLDELVDVPHTPKQSNKIASVVEKIVEVEIVGDNNEKEEDGLSDDTDDPDDPEYENVSESEESNEESEVPDNECGSDDELHAIRANAKKFKDSLYNAMNIPQKSPSSFESQNLRSLSSSSEDENSKIGYVGPPNPKKKKAFKKIGGRDEVPKWEVGMKFVSMAEFREFVRRYGVLERRGVQFVTNDGRRCQVCCEGECPFYMWCSRDKDSETCTIKILVDSHFCTKPYSNKMATTRYLCDLFGDRIRKNPQWSCKEMAETIKNELEIQVAKIKILRLRKMPLEGIADSLKQHYSRVKDFGHEVLLSNARNNSWRWFISLMRDDLDLEDGFGLTIISDQQKGLENVVNELLPSVEHRLCTRHLCANFKKK
ncbi:hypothetical protein AgCh_020812 [Apium graveolens]